MKRKPKEVSELNFDLYKYVLLSGKPFNTVSDPTLKAIFEKHLG